MLNKEEIIEIISPLNFWGKKQETGLLRQGYLSRLREYIQAREVAVAIIGIRRAGKTYIAKQILEDLPADKTLYVFLEDPKFEPYLSAELLDEIYRAYREHISPEGEVLMVLDEVQNIPSWERWVRTMLEKKEKVKIVITGSSSKLLFSDIATILTGRTLSLEVFPLGFTDFLFFKNERIKRSYELTAKKTYLKRLLQEYIKYGGFPGIVLEKNPVIKTRLLTELFEGIVYKDIVAKHKIKNAALVKVVTELAINNYAKLGSAMRIRNIVGSIISSKISPNYVLQILSYLKEAYLVFQVPIFSYKIKEQKLYPKKYYCIDTGLINTVTIRFSENIGRVYENITAINLIRKHGENNIFYWRYENQAEVDFVVKEKLKIRQLIQVCYDISDRKTKKRELFALEKAHKELRCDRDTELLVITDNYRHEEKMNNLKIMYKPLLSWLFEMNTGEAGA